MKKISKIGIENLIFIIDIKSKIDNYYQPQIEILKKDKMKYFLSFCNNISKYSFVDKLSNDNNIRRIRTDKKVEDILQFAHKSIACGIKIVKNPIVKINHWDFWENGYIEIFARMNDNKNHTDWFIWDYIEIDKLKIILNEFKNDLYYLGYDI